MTKADLINASASVKARVTSDMGSKIKKSASEACLHLATVEACRHLSTVIDLVRSVEDIVGQPGEPCPVQSQTAIKKLRTFLDVRACKPSKHRSAPKPKLEARAEEVDPASDMTCGKPPYVAEIVRTTGGDPFWAAPVRYRSEHEAEIAIIQRATLLKHTCGGYVRHWITSKAEHMIDYGSHIFYGRIRSAADVDAEVRDACRKAGVLRKKRAEGEGKTSQVMAAVRNAAEEAGIQVGGSR